MKVKLTSVHGTVLDRTTHVNIVVEDLELSIMYDPIRKGFVVSECSPTTLAVIPQSSNSVLLIKGPQ